MFDTQPLGEVLRRIRDLDAPTSSSSDLIDLMTAAAAVVSWAEAVGLATVAELAVRRRREHLHLGPGELATGTSEQVDAIIASEVGAALRLSRNAARGRVGLAVSLADRLPGTAAALRDGRVDLARARQVAATTDVLTVEAAGLVEERALPRSGAQTAAQLGAAC